MNLYVRWGGAALLTIGALALGKGYSDYVKRRLEETEGFIALTDFVKGKLEKYRTPADGLFSDFYEERLDPLGLPEALRRGERAASVYADVEEKLAVGKETKECLSSFFSSLGSDYLKGELKRCDGALDKLREILEFESEELMKNLKITKLLLVAASLGILILLI